MRKWLLALLLSASVIASGSIKDDVIHEVSTDKQWFRLVNAGQQSYYCWIEAPGGPYEHMMYPGVATPWYKLTGSVFWECEG